MKIAVFAVVLEIDDNAEDLLHGNLESTGIMLYDKVKESGNGVYYGKPE